MSADAKRLFVYSCNVCEVTSEPVPEYLAKKARTEHEAESGHVHGQIDPEYELSGAYQRGERARSTFRTVSDWRAQQELRGIHEPEY